MKLTIELSPDELKLCQSTCFLHVLKDSMRILMEAHPFDDDDDEKKVGHNIDDLEAIVPTIEEIRSRIVAAAVIALAKRVSVIVEQAKRDLGDNLCGYTVTDLVADQITDVSLSDLRTAIVVAGYREKASIVQEDEEIDVWPV